MSHQAQYPQLNDESWLRQRYVVEGRNAVQIASEVGCHREAVGRALDRLGIERVRRGPGSLVIPQLQDPEWLRHEIVEKPTRQIAEELGCTYSAVRGALVRHKIEIPKRTKYRRVDKSEAIKRGLARRYPEGRGGESAGRWTGGRIVRSNYVWLHRDLVAKRWPNHPRLALPNWSHKQEHILVMEDYLDRLLKPGEDVHHGPGGTHDNRIENLTYMPSRGEHISAHWRDAKDAARLRLRVEYLERLLRAHDVPFEDDDPDVGIPVAV